MELELSIGWGAEMILTGWLECLLFFFFNLLPLLWNLMRVSLFVCCLRAKFSVVSPLALLIIRPACFKAICYCSMLSPVWLFATPWTAAGQASLSSTISQSLLKLMSTESVMPSNHLFHCCPLLLLPSIFLSIRVFSNEQALHIRWPKYWSFSCSNSPTNEYSGLISFRMDWFDLLVVTGAI